MFERIRTDTKCREAQTMAGTQTSRTQCTDHWIRRSTHQIRKTYQNQIPGTINSVPNTVKMISDFAKVSKTRQTELYHLFHISKYYFDIYLRGGLQNTMKYLNPSIWCSTLNRLTFI